MAWTEKQPDGTYRACWRDANGTKRRKVIDPKTRRRMTQGDSMTETWIADGARHYLRILAISYADHPDFRDEWRL